MDLIEKLKNMQEFGHQSFRSAMLDIIFVYIMTDVQNTSTSLFTKILERQKIDSLLQCCNVYTFITCLPESVPHYLE